MKERVTVLTGGVGGAKLVLGLAHATEPSNVVAIVNTGDDFEHLGLSVSPDIDTLLYTLSGKSNASQGWGREGETWNFMDALRSLGGEDWFALGDADLALHALRTLKRKQGESLSSIVSKFATAWNIGVKILPMSDEPVATRVGTKDGELAFQHYFVKERCAPEVRQIRFDGASDARAAAGVVDAIVREGTKAVLIAPSNPFLSIDPILSIADIRGALRETPAPVIAVSPLVAGRAVKGPTAKIMRELGLEVTARSIARHYGELIDGMVVDFRDPPADLAVAEIRTDTVMNSIEDRIRVARAALQLADRLRSSV